MKRKGYYGLWFYVSLFLMCIINDRDFMSFKYMLPTHILLIIAWWDGAFKDLPGYIIKHHKFIIAHIFLWYILPDLMYRFKSYALKIIMDYRKRGKIRINREIHVTPFLVNIPCIRGYDYYLREDYRSE